MNIEWYIPAGTPPKYWTDERCFITELTNNDAASAASLAVARVEPGVTTQLHSLTGTTEVYIIRKGCGLAEIDGVEQLLQVGDQAIIPAGAAQRIRNDGDTDLEFYCLCTPRFIPDCYVNLED